MSKELPQCDLLITVVDLFYLERLLQKVGHVIMRVLKRKLPLVVRKYSIGSGTLLPIREENQPVFDVLVNVIVHRGDRILAAELLILDQCLLVQCFSVCVQNHVVISHL